MLSPNNFVIANWKMNGSAELVIEYRDTAKAWFANENLSSVCQMVVCPSLLHVADATRVLSDYSIGIGAQDLAVYRGNGAYTGAVSADMLYAADVGYVIIGHSERRNYYCETDQQVADKLASAVTCGLVPIVCIGESLDERQSDNTEQVLHRQLTAVFTAYNKQCNDDDRGNDTCPFIIAYEPIWAIGGKVSATSEQITLAHQFIKSFIVEHAHTAVDNYSVLYGGSVNLDTIDGIASLEGVDGVLVGGASLQPQSFFGIFSQVNRLCNLST